MTELIRLPTEVIDRVADLLVSRGLLRRRELASPTNQRYSFSLRLLTKLADQVFAGLGPGQLIIITANRATYQDSGFHVFTPEVIASWQHRERQRFYASPGGGSNIDFILWRLVHAAWAKGALLAIAPGKLVFVGPRVTFEVTVPRGQHQPIVHFGPHKPVSS